jgi:hypothetical protein
VNWCDRPRLKGSGESCQPFTASQSQSLRSGMAKIIAAGSGPQEPDEQPAKLPPSKVEVTVTPAPKTRKQSRANKKAARLTKASQRQDQTAHGAPESSKTQKRRQRKRERELRYQTIQADLARGVISEEQAKNRLPRRQGAGKHARE